MMRQKWDAVFIAESDEEHAQLKEKVDRLAGGYTHPLEVTTDDPARTVSISIAEFKTEVV